MTRHLPEQDRRAQILTAARHCFVENGFHPTRMDDIAREAGLSKGGVYFHFKSKQEVFDSLLEGEYQRSMALLQQIAANDEALNVKLMQLGAHYLEFFSSSPDEPRFMIVMGEMAIRNEEVAQRLLDMQTTFIEQIQKLVERGIEEGLFKPVNARSVAVLFKALVDGVEGMHALRYPIDGPATLQAALDMTIEGLRPRE